MLAARLQLPPAFSQAFLWRISLLGALLFITPCLHCSPCNKSCGNLSIAYPFSLDDRCGHRSFRGLLNCSLQNNTFLNFDRKQYRVISLQYDSLLIDPVSSCDATSGQAFPTKQTSGQVFWVSNYTAFFQAFDCQNTTPHCSSDEKTDCSLFPRSGLGQKCSLPTNACCSRTNYTSLLRDNCSRFLSWELFNNSNEVVLTVQYGLRLNFTIPGECNLDNPCTPSSQCIQNTDQGYVCKCPQIDEPGGYRNGAGCSAEGSPSSSPQSSPPPPLCTPGESTTLTCSQEVSPGALIAAALISTATIMAAVILAFALVRTRSSWLKWKRLQEMENFDELLSPSGSLSTSRFSYRELERATKGFSVREKVGEGASATVYAGRLQDGRLIAVKRISFFGQHGWRQIANEVNVLSSVKHKNLIQFLGCCIGDGSDPLLVFEYVPNGTLYEHLKGERGRGLDLQARIAIVSDTAAALAFLHSFTPPIFHRDIKSRNILLDHDLNVKVADFGLSRLAFSVADGCDHISTTPQGTPGYLDPEYHQNYRLSDKSDVYSFGVVLMEVITALSPVDFNRAQREVNLSAHALAKITAGTLDEIIDPRLEPEKYPRVRALVHQLAEVAFRCLAYQKDDRPSMADIVEELRLIQKASRTLAEEKYELGSRRLDEAFFFSSQDAEVSSSIQLRSSFCEVGGDQGWSTRKGSSFSGSQVSIAAMDTTSPGSIQPNRQRSTRSL